MSTEITHHWETTPYVSVDLTESGYSVCFDEGGTENTLQAWDPDTLVDAFKEAIQLVQKRVRDTQPAPPPGQDPPGFVRRPGDEFPSRIVHQGVPA